MLDGMVVAARAVKELSAAVDAAVGQVQPEVGREAALGADPVLGRNLGRVFELKLKASALLNCTLALSLFISLISH